MTYEGRQRAFNAATLVVVLLLVAAGVVGSLAFRGSGPFAAAADGSFPEGERWVCVESVKGNADIERAGIAMEPLAGMRCIEGDVVGVREGSEVRLSIGEAGAVVLPAGSVALVQADGVVEVLGLMPADDGLLGVRQGSAGEAAPAASEASSAFVATQDAAETCAVSVRCDSVLSHMDQLARGKDIYIPGDGIIYENANVPVFEGESAFDVLRRICGEQGIQLEYSYIAAYDSYYVEGIGNLYELDCGPESGWMFKVNGDYPNYGSSEYELKPGDALEFVYSCAWREEETGMEAAS